MTWPEGGSDQGQGGWWEPQANPQQPPAQQPPHQQPPQPHPQPEQYPALGYPPQYPGDPQQQYPVDPQQQYPQPGVPPQGIPPQYPQPGVPPQQYPQQQYHPTQQYPAGEFPPQPPYQQPPYGPQYPQQGWEQQWDPQGNPLPPKRNRNLAIVLSVAALVVVAAVVVALVLVNRHSNSSTAASSTSPASAPASTTDSGSSATTGPDSTATNQPQSTIPGWTAVAVGSVAAADVPPGWATGAAASAVAPTASAIAGVAACPNMPSSFRGIVEPLTASSSDVNAILQSALVQFSYDGENPQIALAPPHPTTDGTFQDYRAVIGLTPPTGTQNCDPPQAIVHILLKTDSSGNTVAVAVEGDQQCNEAPDPNDLDKIAMSVRSVS